MAHTMSWSEAELAYLAGTIDSDGCILARKNKGVGYETKLLVTTTSSAIVNWLVEHFDGYVYKHHRKQPMYAKSFANNYPILAWQLYNIDSLLVLLPELIPYLVLKKKSAEILFEIVQIRNRRSPGLGYNPEQKQTLLDLIDKFKQSVKNRRNEDRFVEFQIQ